MSEGGLPVTAILLARMDMHSESSTVTSTDLHLGRCSLVKHHAPNSITMEVTELILKCTHLSVVYLMKIPEADSKQYQMRE